VTKAQEVYERVEALVASGVRKADAFRQVADEFEQPFNSMRGAYYAHTRTLGGTPSRPRKTKTEVIIVDPIEHALTVLTEAVEVIDNEIAAAKARVDEAQAEYEHLQGTANERKEALQAKIEALQA
jgi:hypothetical protein